MEVTIEEIFEAMSEGERCHMVNKLNKKGYQPQKLVVALREAEERVEELEEEARELDRQFDIVSDACDFWKEEAIDRGYEE